MQKFQYLFNELDSEESMEALAALLGSGYANGIIPVYPPAGTGSVRKLKLEQGLSLRVFDFEPAVDIEFCKIGNDFSDEKKFHLVFFFAPELLTIKNKKIDKSFPVQKGMNVLFASDDISIELDVPAGKTFRALHLSITATWLQKAYEAAEPGLLLFIQQLVENTVPSVFFESTPPNEFLALDKLHRSVSSGRYDALQVKAETLFLVSRFFNKIFSRSPQEVLSSKFVYYDKMMLVEKLLADHLEKKLPPVDYIARQSAMSTSTLKRHFKLMFGKSIYEYYLNLKMDYAKKIIMDGSFSVNEVAFMLDYEKVSNFIDMFKKYHGISPGVLRRTIASS